MAAIEVDILPSYLGCCLCTGTILFDSPLAKYLLAQAIHCPQFATKCNSILDRPRRPPSPRNRAGDRIFRLQPTFGTHMFRLHRRGPKPGGTKFRGYSSVGRALEWHSRGRRFDSV
ncbi:hypothetical protein MTBSS4_70167 [Magnetospirillum sp. SS-4]|nr:hypothetical protein MTBSS4_70167 [Magnetospirillum sp. SS-4]